MSKIKNFELISNKLDRKLDKSRLANKKNKYAIIAFILVSAFWVFTIITDQFHLLAMVMLIVAFFCSLHYRDRATRAVSELGGYLDAVSDIAFAEMQQDLLSKIVKDCEDCEDKDDCESVVKNSKPKKTAKK